MITGYRRFQITQIKQPRIVDALKAWIVDSAPLPSLVQTETLTTYVLEGAQATWPTREFEAECGSYDRGAISTQVLQALCERHLTLGECTCGIYVVKGPDMVQDYKDWPVLAAITGWGVYTEHEKLWRMQYARIEHLWIDPTARDYKYHQYDDDLIEQLKARYEVGVELRWPDQQVCCGRSHEIAYWPSKDGPISICKMSTEHIVNALRYINRPHDRTNAAWKRVFELELERRRPSTGLSGKKTVVSF